jgi:hypothetical protein
MMWKNGLRYFSGVLLFLPSCGGSGGAAGAGVLSSTDDPDATTGDGGAEASAPLAEDAAIAAPCGQQGQTCCSSGALCSAGLTCSDEYCLGCGPAPAYFAGCTNVASGSGVVASVGVSPGGGPPDDPRPVVDQNVCTSWNYGNYGDENAFWEVDLGQVVRLDALTIWPKMTPADGRVRLSIQHRSSSTDAWASYPTTDGLSLTLHDYQPWETPFDPPLYARFFRITIVDTPSFAALREVGLFTGCNRSVATDGG